MMIKLLVNGTERTIDVEASASLLWVIRERFGLTGSKFGCGKGICGACTVLVDGEAQRSCSITVGDVQGRSITTVEGLPDDHAVKLAWIAEQVPQCGYCQPGQIIQATDLLSRIPGPARDEILEAMNGVLCRCGTYPRILRAIQRAAQKAGEETEQT